MRLDRITDEVKSLNVEDISNYISKYLNETFANEIHEIEELEIARNYLKGSIFAKHIDPFGRHDFHLSSHAAMRYILQLGMLYACIDQKIERLNRAFWLVDFNIRCVKPVIERNWTLAMTCTDKTERGDMCFYSADFAVNDNAFTGSATVAMRNQFITRDYVLKSANTEKS